jgi:hypothetical protein
VAGSPSPGTAAAAWANPANQPSRRRRRLRPWIGGGRAAASGVHMLSRIGGVMVPSSSTLRAIPTDRRSQGDRHATRRRRPGQVAGSPDRSRLDDGDTHQLLGVPRGHRSHDGGWQKAAVTVPMTLLAVARAEPGWPQPDRHHRSAAVLVGAHSAGALVAVGPPPLSRPGWGGGLGVGARDQGQGSRHPRPPGLADDRQLLVIPEAATRGLPGQPGSNRPPLGVAADG